jgi:SAM-dependent methyltransferase
MALYDRLGRTYTRTRETDPRLAAVIWDALGDARTVVNVGAGTGSYEPPDRELTAVEPSAVMIAQRSPDAAPVVRAGAEALPFADDSFDAAMAVLTLHHWADWRAGVAEMRRVARDRVLVFTWDPSFAERFWLSAEYFGDEVDHVVGGFATLAQVSAELGGASAVPVLVPHDCRDGFFSAYWRRPEAYLDPDVRAGISTFAAMSDADLEVGLERLRADLDTGAWHERHRDLAELDALDVGFRLLVVPAAGAAVPGA